MSCFKNGCIVNIYLKKKRKKGNKKFVYDGFAWLNCNKKLHLHAINDIVLVNNNNNNNNEELKIKEIYQKKKKQ